MDSAANPPPPSVPYLISVNVPAPKPVPVKVMLMVPLGLKLPGTRMIGTLGFARVPILKVSVVAPDVPEVVYFADEDNRRAAVIAHDRLVAARQVDDLQPYRAQRNFAALVYPLLVRPPVTDGLDDAPGHIPVPYPAQTRESRNSAHVFSRFPETFSVSGWGML